MRWFILLCLTLAYGVLSLYRGDIGNTDGLLFKYFSSSQSAIVWQCAFIFLTLFACVSNVFVATHRSNGTSTLLDMVTIFAWTPIMAGFTGLLMRWYESYLLRPDASRIPVTSLYEVFILFLVIATPMHLYYEERFGVRKSGGFAFALTAVVIGFVL